MRKATIITAVFVSCALLAASIAFALGGFWHQRAAAQATLLPQQRPDDVAVGVKAIESVRVEFKDGVYYIVPIVQFENTSDRGVKLENGRFDFTLHGRKKAADGKEETKSVPLGEAPLVAIELPGGEKADREPAKHDLWIPVGRKDDATVGRLFEAMNLFCDPSYQLRIEVKGGAEVWAWGKSGENLEGWGHVGNRMVQVFLKPSSRKSTFLN